MHAATRPSLPFRARAAVVAVTVTALAAAPSAGAWAAPALLPEEDRVPVLAEGEDLRLFDLLPPAEAAPEPEADVAEADEAAWPEPAPVEPTTHTVGAGESLADIAALHGIEGEDGWRRLYDANPAVADPDVVEVGTSLRIPEEDEALDRRPLPEPVVPARPARERASRSAPGGAAGPGPGVWDRLAACEAGGNWAANTGNGYYGGLQFSAASWAAVGGTGLPHQHDRGTQIAMGERLRAAQGWGAWPSCSRRLGLR
jgi:hypothetical protein